MSPVPTCAESLPLSTSECKFVITEDPTLTYYYHPNSTVYVVLLLVLHSLLAWINVHVSIIVRSQEYFHCPKNPMCSVYPSFPLP